jgi:hypothetical protein
LNSIGTGIINGPSYISVYNYPVLFFNKRSTSRGQTRRRTKRQTEVTSSPPKNSNNYTVNMNETNVSKYVTDNDPLDQIVSRLSLIFMIYSTGKPSRFTGYSNSTNSQLRENIKRQL